MNEQPPRHRSVPDQPLLSLHDAATLAGCQVRDLLNYANEKKFDLLTGVPDGVDLRVYDDSTKHSIPPFLMSPQLLVLRHSYYLKIVLNGRTEQSDFPDGYLIESTGKLRKLSPNYGYPELSHTWVYWKTCLGNLIRPIELIPERLFILHDDLVPLIAFNARKEQAAIDEAKALDENRSDSQTAAIDSSEDTLTDSQGQPMDRARLAKATELADAFKVMTDADENLRWFRDRCTNCKRNLAFQNALKKKGSRGAGRSNLFDVLSIAAHLDAYHKRVRNKPGYFKTPNYITYLRSRIERCFPKLLDEFDDRFSTKDRI